MPSSSTSKTPSPSGILIQKKSRVLGREEALVNGYAQAHDIPVRYASLRQVERGQVSLVADELVVGDVPFCLCAMRHLGCAQPSHEPYPSVLAHHLHRWTERDKPLRHYLDAVRTGEAPMFIKPARGWKRFTGFVLENPDDFRVLNVSRSTPVFASQPVRFVSEWRVYVVGVEIQAIKFCDFGGDRAITPSVEVIQDAVLRIAERPLASAGYVVDFGVLDSGETALIELNDGFAFGAYDDLDAEVYVAVASARWRQLMESRNA
jgi:hypothetical protein